MTGDPMSLPSLLQSYGYIAVILGTFLEGETILILAGFLAHQGYLQMQWVVGAAFLGSMAGDQLYFLLGRRYGGTLLARRPVWQAQAARVDRLLVRFRSALILGFRFLYGMRTVTPFVLGMGAVSSRKFVLLNGVGALAWALVIGSAGYLFGAALETLLVQLKHYELFVAAGIGSAGIAVWVAYWIWRRGRSRGMDRH
jgi:membrane protein DedA with SNARE-associated domain